MDQAVSDAKNTEGIQVIKDSDVWHNPSSNSESNAKKDYQNQADTIKKQVDSQKQKLNEYNKQKQEYDKKRQAFIDQLKQEGLWQEGTTDPTTLVQHLTLASEPQANAEVKLLQNIGNFNKEEMQLYTNQGITNIKGDFLQVTYTNLSNSSYAGQKIAKIVETFSDMTNINNNNAGAKLYCSQNPISGYTYNLCSGVSVELKFYNENDQLIQSKSPAYLTVASLNNYSVTAPAGVTTQSNRIEKCKAINGKAIPIPESSIQVHDGNILYADKDNTLPALSGVDDNNDPQKIAETKAVAYKIWGKEIVDKYNNWDNPVDPRRIFGAGLIQYNGNSIKWRSYMDDDTAQSNNKGAWFYFNTTVPQTSFDAEGPQKPELTIHYHDNKVKSLNTITVKYIDQDTNKEIPNTEFTQTGVEGDAIKYSTADTIKKLQDQGYTLVNDGFTNKAEDKLTAQNNDKTYVVTLKKIQPQVKQGTQTFNFVDKATNKTVGTAKVGGDVGKDIPISLKVPDGYKLVEGQKVPTSANIKEEDKPINILVEKINTAKPSIDSLTVKYIDADTGKEIPNTEFNQKSNEGDAITYSTAKTIKDLQSKGYTLVSDDFTNKAGSKLSSENNGKTYVVTLKKVKTTPKVQNGTQTYHFVDKNTGKVLTTNQVKGEVGKDVPISLKVPDGYKLVEGQKVPTSASIKGKDNPINILVEKISKPSQIETPTPAPETPAHTGTPKPADSKGGDKKTQNGTQTFNFVDKATNKTVGTSKVGGEVGKDVAVSLKVPNGYKLVAGQTVPTSATIKDKDTPINILVEKDNNKKPAQQTYQFIDQNGNKVVGTAVVKGNEGDHVPVSLKVPKGYHLVPGQKLPTVADLKATDKPIKILVAKDGTDGNGNADSGINGKNGKVNKGNGAGNNAGNNGNGAGNKAGNGNGGNGVASLPQTGNSKSNAGILAGSALVATMASLGIAYNKKKRNA